MSVGGVQFENMGVENSKMSAKCPVIGRKHKHTKTTNRPRPKVLKICHLNLERGIVSKKGEIEAFLDEVKPDFFAVTEHGLNQNCLNGVILENYTVEASFCRESMKWGGVAIYKRLNCQVKVEVGKKVEFFEEEIFEASYISFTLNERSYLFICIYRSPSSCPFQFLTKLNDFLTSVSAYKNNVIITGDFNIDILSDKDECFEFKDIASSFGMKFLIDVPTRNRGDCGSCLDNFITNVANAQTEVVETFISDHLAIVLCLQQQDSSSDSLNFKCKYRCVNDANLQELKFRLGCESWDEVLSALDVNTKYQSFVSTLQYHIDIACPIKQRNEKPKCKTEWITEEITTMKQTVREAYDDWKMIKSDDLKARYNKLKADYRKLIRDSKAKYYSNLIQKAANPTIGAWKVINRNRPIQMKTVENITLKINNTKIESPKKVSNEFNKFFTNIAASIVPSAGSKNWSGFPKMGENVLKSFGVVTTEEVKKTVGMFLPKNSAGHDGITMKILKSCINEVVNPLTDIINKSFEEAVFPDEGKLAVIKPLFKKGEKTDMSNFRPISLLPTVTKILEKIACERIVEFLEKNYYFFSRQFGFRKKKSTKLALIKLVNEVIDHIEKGETAVGTFIDLTKAFDCVDCNILIEKLAAAGLADKVLEWAISYINNRKQRTAVVHKNSSGEVESYLSEEGIVTRGVPQGSTLGPIFFLIYINDIGDHVEESSLVNFADDTTLVTSGRSLEELQISTFVNINSISQYLSDMQLSINELKTKFLHFKTLQFEKRNPHFGINVMLGEEEIEEDLSAKCLGVVLDNNLKWDPHINELAAKLSTNLYIIRNLVSLLNLDFVKLAYYSLFETHIRYSIVLWGSSSKKNLEKIFKIQKKTIRCMLKQPPRFSCKPLFKKLKILTVPSLYILETILFVKKENIYHLPSHNYNTRHRNRFATTHRLALTETKADYMGQKFFHSLPEEIKNINKINKFKQSLVNYLVDKCYYELPEI
jgi:hypothetical protein